MNINNNSYYYDYCSDSSSDESEAGNEMPNNYYNIKYIWSQTNLERQFLPYDLPASYITDKYTYLLGEWEKQDKITLYFSDGQQYTENQKLTVNLVITVSYIYNINYRIEDENGILLEGATTSPNTGEYSIGDVTPDFGWTIQPTKYKIKTEKKTEEVTEIPKRIYEDYIIIPFYDNQELMVKYVDYITGELLYEVGYLEGETLNMRLPNWGEVTNRPVSNVTYYTENGDIIENMNSIIASNTTISVNISSNEMIVIFQYERRRDRITLDYNTYIQSNQLPVYPTQGIWYLGDNPVNPTTILIDSDKIFSYLPLTTKRITFGWSNGLMTFNFEQRNSELVLEWDPNQPGKDRKSVV